MQWVTEVNSNCGDLCETFTIGNSIQGRALKGIKVMKSRDLFTTWRERGVITMQAERKAGGTDL